MLPAKLALLLMLHGFAHSTTIERSNNGDVFTTATCQQCFQVNQADCSHIEDSCCKKCHCTAERTAYQGQCYSDLNLENFRCLLAIKGANYYGLKTYKLTQQDIGYVMYYGSSEQKRYDKCAILGAYFWNTVTWKDLYTGGRTGEDFKIISQQDGLMMMYLGSAASLYVGMLIKFTVTCSQYEGNLNTCLTIKIYGSRDYSIIPTTIRTSTTTQKTTHNATKKPNTDGIVNGIWLEIGLTMGVAAIVFVCLICMCELRRRRSAREGSLLSNSSYSSYDTTDTFEELPTNTMSDAQELYGESENKKKKNETTVKKKEAYEKMTEENEITSSDERVTSYDGTHYVSFN